MYQAFCTVYYTDQQTHNVRACVRACVCVCTYSETCLNRTPYIPETWTNGK